MDWRDSLYGYIGMQDHTLDPIIRPGSFAQIDSLAENGSARRIGMTMVGGEPEARSGDSGLLDHSRR
jgi:hypothetical protein